MNIWYKITTLYNEFVWKGSRILLHYMFYIIPVKKNKIVFDNFAGKGYGDSPKYIANELLKRNKDFDIVWLVNNLDEHFPLGIRSVKFGTWRAAYELATAKVWIDNVRGWKKVKKKKNQYYIQTWHSTIRIKAIEKDAEETLNKEYIDCAKYDSKITDLLLSGSKYSTEYYRANFWYDGEIVECGLPRNDILINKKESIKKYLYKYLDINESKKIILYAPTFRVGAETENYDIYTLDYEKCRQLLEQKFNCEYVFLIRFHPNVKLQNLEFLQDKNIYNVTQYPDIQELIAFADILITDYSSCMFDAMIALNKVFLYAKDLETYCKKERKLLFDVRNLPCKMATSEKMLFNNIEQFDHAQYFYDCEIFLEKQGFIKTDCASINVANKIESIILD